MKIIIKRIECIDRRGTSKSGKEYHIDATNIYSDVPFESVDDNSVSFGTKELTYQVGLTPSHSHYMAMGLDKLKGLLPMECEVELSQGFDSFGNAKPCITAVTPVKPTPKQP